MYAARTVTPGHLKSHIFNENVFLQLTTSPKNTWIPCDHIAKAYLYSGIWVERLRVEFIDGSEIKLFWTRADNALSPLEEMLKSWLGSNLQWEEK